MKLTCDGRELSEALRLTGLVAQRSQLRILLKAEGDTLRVCATTGAQFITVTLPAQVEDPGVVVTDSILGRLLADGAVTMMQAGKDIRFIQGNAEGEVKVGEADKFQSLPEVPFPMQPCASLLEAARRVSCCCATEESRPVLCCVKVQPVEGGTDVVAADGFRLGVYRVQETYPEMLIPAALLSIVEKAFDPDFGRLVSPETVPVVGMSGSGVVFRAGGVTVGGGLGEGTFPNYGKLIPEGGTPLKCDLSALRSAIERVAHIAGSSPGDPTCSPIVRLEAKDGVLRVWGEAEEEARLAITIPAEGECQIAFNARYLLDGPFALDGERATMYTTSKTGPALFKGDGPMTYVLMPMWVQW